MRSRGQEPSLTATGAEIHSPPLTEDTAELQRLLFSALISLQAEASNEILRRAFAGLSLELALLDVIAPALEEIGQAWHDGEIPIAVEHFATQLCRASIIHAMEADPMESSKDRIVAACAPGEWHEIGLLMLTFLLRRGGWDVAYLGANLSLERFSEVLIELKPRLVLFSASSPATAENLANILVVFDELEPPKPLIGLGGLAFREDPTLMNRIPGTFLGLRADEAVRQIEAILDGQSSGAGSRPEQ
jgi:methanogenic corrinoid protein MtbC1